jgi:hypothetical protein
MLYAGLDLSRKRLDFHLLDAEGATVEVGASPPDADGLRGLSERFRHGEPIHAAIESMNGARFVHDRLELAHGKPCPVSDLSAVASYSHDSVCPSRGKGRSRRVSAWSTSSTAKSVSANASYASSAPTTNAYRCS